MSQPIKTAVCIVGGGPAGVVLAYLLARNNIEVTLLEAQKDFDRHFRGDTLHYSIMENLAEMGLAQRLLQKPHHKLPQLGIQDKDKFLPIVEFRHIDTSFPYVTLMNQVDFLEFMVAETRQFPHFHIMMHTMATDLIEENGRVTGICYRDTSNREEGKIEAELIVACDGRSSKMRQAAGLTLKMTTEPMDLLWFRLPRTPADASNGLGAGFVGGRTLLLTIDRQDYFQIGINIPHGSYRTLKQQGIGALHEIILAGAPHLADRLHLLDDWSKVALLTVAGGRLPTWYQDGLLFIGDAAHVMTPIGGVGINYAIQDAIEAANVLVAPLQAGAVTVEHLAEVQRRRRWPTLFIQTLQAQAQKRILDPQAMTQQRPFTFPKWMRLLPRIPILRNLPGRIIGGGVRRVKVAVV